MHHAVLLAGVIVFASVPGHLHAQVFGMVGAEVRLFPSSPLLEEQSRHSGSLVFRPEFRHDWARGRQSVVFEGFLRLDAADEQRSKVDIRELTYQQAWTAFELTVGIGRVFWGVTESQHLVDIVNQTDLVENIDREEKLGQPMVNVALVQNWGTVGLFVLPGFREQTFSGVQGRLRFPTLVSQDSVAYESSARRKHIDLAARYSHFIGAWDIGLSHFYGTTRDPRLVPGTDSAGNDVLIPLYELIHQTGLDLQMTSGGLLLKVEGITRSGQGERYFAATGGFEYTFVGVLGSPADVGVLAEYLWDDRGRRAPTAFQNDVFFGTRVTLNDIQSSELLAGAFVDPANGSTLLRLEAARRLGSSWRLEVEGTAFVGIEDDDPLFGLRRDHNLRLILEKYF